ncbi:hypothetical protein EB834_02455 [Brevibacterium aurantiacum]|uniref:Uncharacterized protein n=1 Tax=Brevibacterium aurantiacum TaxID=273384 RepID=A0A4Z0KT09_BREAU|nr:hypothetical protein EB834_02455 [Brevibacterium aurantiacum]
MEICRSLPSKEVRQAFVVLSDFLRNFSFGVTNPETRKLSQPSRQGVNEQCTVNKNGVRFRARTDTSLIGMQVEYLLNATIAEFLRPVLHSQVRITTIDQYSRGSTTVPRQSIKNAQSPNCLVAASWPDRERRSQRRKRLGRVF